MTDEDDAERARREREAIEQADAERAAARKQADEIRARERANKNGNNK